MNQHLSAEDLDRQIDRMFSGGGVTMDGESSPLLAIAGELQLLADPDFKCGLAEELTDTGVPVEAPFVPALDNPQSARLLASIMPTLSGKGFNIFPADHRSFLVSFVSHAALVLLIVSGIWVGQRPIIRTTQLLTEKLTYLGSGGGGGGDHSPIPATKGTPPKFSNVQLTPPVIVVRNPNPALPVDPTVLGPPVLNLPQSNQIGDLMSSNAIIPSNGTGSGGGAGSGFRDGLGSGTGPGVGDGFDSGFGRGHSHAGVTAPRAIYDPEPEYSEEARKVHFQGVVVLSIVVDPTGHARDVRVARSVGLGLDERAIEAVKKWKFEPGMKDGHPIAVGVNVEVNFRLY
jgi:periplasmic protein TonB